MTSASSNVDMAVLGAGSWGTALAAHLAGTGHKVCLWGRDQPAVAKMAETRCNHRYLPGVKLPGTLTYTHRLDSATTAADVIIVATPCHSFTTILDGISPTLKPETVLLWACKGITRNQLLHEVVQQKFGHAYPVAVISGPSFAGELARGLPTAATVASHDMATANRVSRWFHGETFRAYASDDIIGVQIAGALKNVFAIAAGISDGLGYGANARAALITRGLAELMRLGTAMGARPETLMGLSGVGDLVLTCTDDQSRNRRFGLALGQGKTSDAATSEIGQVVEGINTSREASQLAKTYQVDMPITDEVYQVIHGDKTPQDAVLDLLARAPRAERE